jgi:hypothetical protein
MNKSLEIIFEPGGEIRLELDRAVEGFSATAQNALVNLITDKGRDKIFPDRGTNLLQAALATGLSNRRAASHQANFAAADTLFFSRENELAPPEDKLARVSLVPSKLNLRVLELQATFVSVDNRVLSFPITNPVF